MPPKGGGRGRAVATAGKRKKAETLIEDPADIATPVRASVDERQPKQREVGARGAGAGVQHGREELVSPFARNPDSQLHLLDMLRFPLESETRRDPLRFLANFGDPVVRARATKVRGDGVLVELRTMVNRNRRRREEGTTETLTADTYVRDGYGNICVPLGDIDFVAVVSNDWCEYAVLFVPERYR